MNATPAVRERPILFSGEMVRAILDGRKTQTRRVVKPQPPAQFPVGWVEGDAAFWSAVAVGDFPMWERYVACPFGQPGDRLWVRETHVLVADGPLMITPGVVYDADGRAAWNVPMRDGSTVYNYDKPEVWKRRAARFLRREHARLTLELTDVRVERVQDISEDDAKAEGAQPDVSDLAGYTPYKSGFAHMWHMRNAKRGDGWDVNKWVWVREFRRIDA